MVMLVRGQMIANTPPCFGRDSCRMPIPLCTGSSADSVHTSSQRDPEKLLSSSLCEGRGDDTRGLHSASLEEFAAALFRHLEVWDFGISHPPGFGGTNHFKLPNAPVPETEKTWEKEELL
ncbi:uncharacterized protein RBU57_007923 [Macrochelys suwanniensis]